MAGTYDVIRTFDANGCGLGTYSGEATLRTGEGGSPNAIFFGMETDTPDLSFMEYRGTAADDGSFEAVEDVADYYATISGVYSGGTITFTERIVVFKGPCKDMSLTTQGTATKK
jgi:hypothetical protein